MLPYIWLVLARRRTFRAKTRSVLPLGAQGPSRIFRECVVYAILSALSDGECVCILANHSLPIPGLICCEEKPIGVGNNSEALPLRQPASSSPNKYAAMTTTKPTSTVDLYIRDVLHRAYIESRVDKPFFILVPIFISFYAYI